MECWINGENNREFMPGINNPLIHYSIYPF